MFAYIFFYVHHGLCIYGFSEYKYKELYIYIQ